MVKRDEVLRTKTVLLRPVRATGRSPNKIQQSLTGHAKGKILQEKVLATVYCGDGGKKKKEKKTLLRSPPSSETYYRRTIE